MKIVHIITGLGDGGAEHTLYKICKYDKSNNHIIISLINDFYSSGKECVIENNLEENFENLKEIEKKIVKILNEKIRPAVAKDGGDIKFKEFKDGVVKVQLQGSC